MIAELPSLFMTQYRERNGHRKPDRMEMERGGVARHARGVLALGDELRHDPVHRAAEVVRRLRDFFRQGTTRLERVSAAKLLEGVREIGANAKDGSPIALALEVDQDLPDILVDRLQIELVMRNLISNAMEAMDGQPVRGQITVTARRRRGPRWNPRCSFRFSRGVPPRAASRGASCLTIRLHRFVVYIVDDDASIRDSLT
jgi:signal transduction histidine kinase